MSASVDLAYIAHLARIGVTEDELSALDQNIQRTMTLIDRMQAADTADVAPMAHPLSVHQPLRPDTTETIDDTALQHCAPPNSVAHQLYLVPQVIE